MRRLPTLLSPTTLVVAFGLVTVLAIGIAASTSTAAFGVYNSGWDGTSEVETIAADAGATTNIARDTTAYTQAPPNRTVAIILSPEQAYGPPDHARVASFVRNGGTVLVADDYGTHSNALLATVGAQARLDGRPLRDERVHHRAPAMPVARNVTDHALVDGVDALTLNHGTAVTPANATVLVRTSGYAYLDTNRNATLDDAEAVERYPVATVEAVGDGRVIVVSDPSVLINAMLERPGNRAFARSIVDGHDRVLLDYSQTGELPPLAVVLLVLRESVLLQVLCGLVGTLAIAFGTRPGVASTLRATLPSAGSRDTAPESDADTFVAYLRERHPEWDDERIRRVVAARRDEREE